MNNNEKKQENALKKIGKTVDKLDKYLNELSETDSKHEIKLWFAQKKATHEIKRLLSEVNHYENYEEKELEKLSETDYYQQLTPDDINYITSYFYTY
ncbi:hypothetical protein [Vagococcus fluvialis]|uniref:Uncharacterized protein n=1 Tax=Vagococcus fluvialis TaxID=2738 RepID=A0A7X6DAJ5_9ENTE|nr:hypothetical protein [Vagococcus fluvialis]NKC68538.1 hypothetical protein [Vagococcus fluvialis]